MRGKLSAAPSQRTARRRKEFLEAGRPTDDWTTRDYRTGGSEVLAWGRSGRLSTFEMQERTKG